MNSKISLIFAVLCSALRFASAAVACDRACLEDLVSIYFGALGAHNPTGLPLAENVTYVENEQVLEIGMGLWATSSSPGTYRHIFADPEAGQVTTITTIRENGVPVIISLRLKVEVDLTISQVDVVITRDAAGAARYEKMEEPEAVWLESVPQEKRLSRSQLIVLVDKYYAGTEHNDPKGDYTFIDKECNRIGDALMTTNENPRGAPNQTVASLSCEAQFRTGVLGTVTRIRERRYPVVDEERQTVVAVPLLDHDGTVRTLPSVNGTSSPVPAYFDVPRTLQRVEALRMRDDKIFRIESILVELPYGSTPVFPHDAPRNFSYPGTSSVAANPCDQACLFGVLDQVLQALLAHNVSGLPLSQRASYAENGQRLAIGDGLWGTVSQVAKPDSDAYAARFADAANGTVGYWGAIKEHSTPAVLALRIQVGGRKISGIEAVSVRAEADGKPLGTKTLMRPPLPVEWDGSSLGKLDSVFQQASESGKAVDRSLIESYFSGVENHSSEGVSLAPGCVRRDNGFQANASCAIQLDGNGPYSGGLHNVTGAVRDRRTWLQDAGRGVVMAVAVVDSPAMRTFGMRPLTLVELTPGSFLVIQLIKVVNGTISRVESMIKWVPQGYRYLGVA